MDSDRTLLEKAAKAAGIEGVWDEGWQCIALKNGEPGRTHWSPLTDDGDALRLAVKLRMRVDPWGSGAAAVVSVDNRSLLAAEPHYGDDPERATRLAIVRAAAELGDKHD